MIDPFSHHPNLRSFIKPSKDSFFRTITTEQVKEMLANSGLPLTLEFYDDETRETLRRKALANHKGDLLIFAYGSLIWDPALEFSEIRHAFAPKHQRRFILVDTHGGRGTAEAPGLMAALDNGKGCEGFAFKISAEKVETETEILFRREMIAPGYHARFITVQIDGVDKKALTFVADHTTEMMLPNISRNEQIRYVATGVGILGSSLEYLQNTVKNLDEIGINDTDASELLEQVLLYQANASNEFVE